MLLGRDTELVVEGVVPDLLHVVPVGDDAVLNRVLERQDTCKRHVTLRFDQNGAKSIGMAKPNGASKRTALGLGLITDVRVLLSHADHHTLMSRATDD